MTRRKRTLKPSEHPRWCDFAEHEHEGNHVHHIGELLLAQPSPSYVVAVTIESSNDSADPWPVLTIGGRYTNYCQALMRWEQADALASPAHRGPQALPVLTPGTDHPPVDQDRRVAHAVTISVRPAVLVRDGRASRRPRPPTTRPS